MVRVVAPMVHEGHHCWHPHALSTLLVCRAPLAGTSRASQACGVVFGVGALAVAPMVRVVAPMVHEGHHCWHPHALSTLLVCRAPLACTSRAS